MRRKGKHRREPAHAFCARPHSCRVRPFEASPLACRARDKAGGKKIRRWLQRNRQQRVHETPHAEAHARTTAPATACPDGRSGQGAPTFPAASRTSIPSLTTAAGQEEGAATRAAAERGSRRVQQAASTPTRSVRTCPRPPLRVLLGAAPLGAFAALALPQHEPIQTARLGRARARGHHHTLPLRTAGLGCTSNPARQAACPRRLPAP